MKIATTDAYRAGLSANAADRPGVGKKCKKNPTTDDSASGLEADLAAKLAVEVVSEAGNKTPTTDASASVLLAEAAARFVAKVTGKAEAGHKVPTVPANVENTDGSSDYGSFKIAAILETMKGGDVALSQTDNVERNPSKQAIVEQAAIANK
jgi:hypothetical protein